MKDFRTELAEHKEKIDSNLEYFFNKKLSSCTDFNKNIIEKIKEFTLRGGKRIRPILVIEGFNAFKNINADKNKEHEEIVKASMCVELMQSSFLIHDDIMDEALLRRNKPTLHKIFEKEITGKGKQRYGESLAILAGNLAMKFGQDIIINSNFDKNIKMKALLKFNDIVETTNYGQLLDLQLGLKPLDKISEEEIELIHLFKTAKYTIECPLQLGAIFANASDKDIAMLSDFAIPLGRAFQVQDDILDVFGDEKKLGKSVISDIKENKKTLLVYYAYKNATHEDKEFMLKSLGNEITMDEFEKLKQIIIKTGSLDYSKKRFNELITLSKHNLEKIKIRKDAKEFLFGLIDYMCKREM